MAFLRLPDELLLSVVSYLTLQREINSLARTNARLYNLLNTYLYRYNVEQNKSSALLWAVKNGQEETAKKSIAEGANVQPVSELTRTPLSWAAWNGNETVVKLLLATDGVDANPPSSGGETLLSLAAWNGHEEVVKLLLATQGVKPDSRTSRGETSLSLQTV
ncbi:ankyrin repeat-containing domain protein [Aspergillus minisclerotigenes]|uniref:Ankyrin repeat-containing domain protein n=1 Tax=Aspergillus minisclerotigenes TaxID=656917 RepID=A0A5N6JAX8_9EURO|nr:ankyrin repeat-containing domain protein [Aspergillus minisclerotigenes]